MSDNSKILFRVDYQHISRVDRRLVIASNTKNVLIANFSFTEEWNEFDEVYATFRKDGKTYSILLDENKECVVPWEVLKPGRFVVGVYGGDLYTSDGLEIVVDKCVYEEGLLSPSDPTKTIYTDLKERIEKLELTSGVGGGSDLSSYVKDPNYVHTDNNFTKVLKEKLESIDLEKYAKKIDLPDLTNYATKEEIPSLDDYVKSENLPNLEEYAKKSEIPNLDEYVKSENLPNLDDYAKIEDIPTYVIPTKLSELDNDENYITETILNSKFEEIGIQLKSISDLIGGE